MGRREFSPSSSSPKQYYDLNDNKLPFLEALINPISIGVPGLYSMLADACCEWNYKLGNLLRAA